MSRRLSSGDSSGDGEVALGSFLTVSSRGSVPVEQTCLDMEVSIMNRLLCCSFIVSPSKSIEVADLQDRCLVQQRN
jgi:hypothetical protein